VRVPSWVRDAVISIKDWTGAKNKSRVPFKKSGGGGRKGGACRGEEFRQAEKKTKAQREIAEGVWVHGGSNKKRKHESCIIGNRRKQREHKKE